MKLKRCYRVYITFSLLILFSGSMIYLMRPKVIEGCNLICQADKKRKALKEKAEAEAAAAAAADLKKNAAAAAAAAEAAAAAAKKANYEKAAADAAEAAKKANYEKAAADAAKVAADAAKVAKPIGSEVAGVAVAVGKPIGSGVADVAADVGNSTADATKTIGDAVTSVAKDIEKTIGEFSECPGVLANVTKNGVIMALIAKNWNNFLNLRCFHWTTRYIFSDYCEVSKHARLNDEIKDLKKKYNMCFPP